MIHNHVCKLIQSAGFKCATRANGGFVITPPEEEGIGAGSSLTDSKGRAIRTGAMKVYSRERLQEILARVPGLFDKIASELPVQVGAIGAPIGSTAGLRYWKLEGEILMDFEGVLTPISSWGCQANAEAITQFVRDRKSIKIDLAAMQDWIRDSL